jgi:hypothetical protein
MQQQGAVHVTHGVRASPLSIAVTGLSREQHQRCG